MICNLCAQNNIESVALWQVGKQGFCRAHKLEAWAAEAEKNKKYHRARVQEETLDKRGSGILQWDRQF